MPQITERALKSAQPRRDTGSVTPDELLVRRAGELERTVVDLELRLDVVVDVVDGAADVRRPSPGGRVGGEHGVDALDELGVVAVRQAPLRDRERLVLPLRVALPGAQTAGRVRAGPHRCDLTPGGR